MGQALGYVLVSIPYFEWNAFACQGLDARKSYLQAKLSLFQGGTREGAGQIASLTLYPFPLFPQSLPLPNQGLRTRLTKHHTPSPADIDTPRSRQS